MSALSIAPALAAYIGRPVKPSVTPTRVEGYAGHLRADRPAATTEQETTMPTGVYPRKKKAEKPAAEPSQKPAKARKPRANATTKAALKPRTTGPRFGVFEDGTIEIKLPTCTGVVGTDDARALVGFLRKIGIKA